MTNYLELRSKIVSQVNKQTKSPADTRNIRPPKLTTNSSHTTLVDSCRGKSLTSSKPQFPLTTKTSPILRSCWFWGQYNSKTKTNYSFNTGG
jgi:hypothetical protein